MPRQASDNKKQTQQEQVGLQQFKQFDPEQLQKAIKLVQKFPIKSGIKPPKSSAYRLNS